jgi:N,N'-diacetyllegionaminate synthase
MIIGSREINSNKPYIIAEIGVNHDGDPERALKLITLASESGADAVKFQLFRADMLMSGASKLAAYQKNAGEHDPLSMLRRLELSIEQLALCVDLAHRLGIHAIVSVFSTELVEVAETLPWDAYKTASPDIIHKPLLTALARTNRPLIISTGAANIDEISRAMDWLSPWKRQIALLQCVSSYPTPMSQAELGGIVALRREYPTLPIGYSDHTPEEATGAIACALGATILEKHFTDNRAAKGPDHAASLDPAGFQRYVEAVRRGGVQAPSVDVVKRVIDIERDVRDVSRQSVVAAVAIPRGATIDASMLTVKRPGRGIEPFLLDAIIGRRAMNDIAPDRPIVGADIEGFT